MTVPSIVYAKYAPEQIKVDSLGIGLSETSNEYMNLNSNQYLIVGQYDTLRSEDPTGYNLIVDHEGVSIRTSIRDRTNLTQEYALYVDGDTRVTGTLITSNLVVLNGSSNGPIVSGGLWNLATGEVDNIYYNGKITIGNNNQAQNNAYPLNITEAADRNIDHAQMSIQNTQKSQMRMGIIGIAEDSPAIINTAPSTRLEFHVGRTQQYFDLRYKTTEFITHTNPNDNTQIIEERVVASEVPVYTSTQDAPHMLIDETGHVGIHTSFVPEVEFTRRLRDPLKPQEINYYDHQEIPELYVANTTYSSNMLIWDNESGMIKNIDELYVRRLGVTIKANQIIPGPFAHGNYTFVSNVSIGGPPDERYDLRVYGHANFTNTTVEDTFNANHFIANDALLLDVASFCNDVYMTRDIIVNQSLRLRGQMYVESLSNLPNGETVSTWNLMQFQAASPGYSNLNVMGTGVSTPGRLGVGINPSGVGFVSDEVNHQMTIIKRDQYANNFPNMFELELLDKSTLGVTRAAWIGHPQAITGFKDGSLVFATPSSTEGDYFSLYKQNIYFFPGSIKNSRDIQVLRETNKPTFGIFEEKRVGILTYEPKTELDVRGSITFTGDMYFYNTATGISSKLGLWKSQDYVDLYNTTPSGLFKGIQYINEEAPYMGVNTIPDNRYGMVVAGGFKSTGGYYTSSNEKMVPWLDAGDSNTTANNVAPSNSFGLFTYGNVGIGVKSPSATLDIKDNYRSANGTTLRLTRSDDSSNAYAGIEMMGFHQTWRLQTDDNLRVLELAQPSSFSNASNERLMWARYNLDLHKYQMVIGCNLSALDVSIVNPTMTNSSTLTVGGDMSVLGDVNITGQFRVYSQNVTVDGQAPTPPPLGQDDVFIGGANIVLTPGSNRKGVFIGNYTFASTDTNSLLRVYQDNAAFDTLATFKSSSRRALIEIENEIGDVVKFGVMNPLSTNTLNVPFAFLDKNNNPYLSFKNVTVNGVSRYVGLNTNNPTAILHVYTEEFGDNMMRLTKRVLGDTATSDACPHIELEKTYNNISPTRWVIQGPNSAWEEKLGLLYQDNTNAFQEVFTFTRNGCFGIGNSTPEFALDIKSTGSRGSLRLLNTDNTSMPQLIFQSGSSTFGADMAMDYRMYSQDDTFTFDMQNSLNRLPILNINSNGHIGIRTDASDRYETILNGSLNIVNGTMLINGSSFLEGTVTDGGVSFRAANLYFRPILDYNGGIIVNGSEPTNNLFHIFGGNNCNLMVFDSQYDECQIHMRNQHGMASDRYNLFRMATSNDSIYWSVFPNSGKDFYVSPSMQNHSNMMKIGPSADTGAFELNVSGSVMLASQNPSIKLNNFGTVGASTSGVHVTSFGNIGIGTTNARDKVHIYASSSSAGTSALRIEQGSTADIAHFTQNGTVRTIVNTHGNVGIGTTIARASLDVIGQIITSNGSSNVPSFAFAEDRTSGIYREGSRIALATNQQHRVSVATDGKVSIGSTDSYGLLTVSSNVSSTLMAVHQAGNGDVMKVSSSVSPHAFTVLANGNVGIGTSTPLNTFHVHGNSIFSGSLLPSSNVAYDIGSVDVRWRDLYLAGNTINLGGTLISKDTTGYLSLSSNVGTSNELLGVVASMIQIGKTDSEQTIYITNDTPGTVTFRVQNPGSNIDKILTPIFLDKEDSTISVGEPAKKGALTIESPMYVGLVIEQNVSSNIAEMYSDGEMCFLIGNDGRVGIGTSSPTAVLEITDSVSDATRYVNIGNEFVIDLSGNVGIHTTAPAMALHVVGSNLFDGRCFMTSNVRMSANLEVYGNTITHGNTVTDSDIRLKNDLNRIESALDKVCSLTGYTFTIGESETKSTGLIAQDVQHVLPEAVHVNGGYLGVAYGNMMGLIVEAIKELRQEVQEIKQKL